MFLWARSCASRYSPRGGARAALELRITADMQLGRHRELISELRFLVETHRFNEWLYAQLIIALGRCGRRGEALQVYGNLRQILGEELGLDPSSDLQQLQYQVLVADDQSLPLVYGASRIPGGRHNPGVRISG